MNYQGTKNKKCDFCFTHIINAKSALIMAAHPCTAGNSDFHQSYPWNEQDAQWRPDTATDPNLEVDPGQAQPVSTGTVI